MSEGKIPYGEICALQFGLLTDDDIEKWNLPEVSAKVTKRVPLATGSINCASNGPSNANSLCLRCGSDFENCQGHLCQKKLAAPVVHVNYLQLLLKIFPTICIRCMRILAPNHLLKKLNQACLASAEAYRKCINDLHKLCSKTNRVCWFPDDNPPQPREDGKKHHHNSTGDQDDERKEEPHLLSTDEALDRGYCGAAQPDMWVVYERFMIRPAWYMRKEEEYDAIPPTTPEKLFGMLKFMHRDLVRMYGFHPDHSPLHGMMISILCIPPPLIRLARGGGHGKEDDLTTFLNNTIDYSDAVSEKTKDNENIRNNNSNNNTNEYNSEVMARTKEGNILNLNLGFIIPDSMLEMPTAPLNLCTRAKLRQYQGKMSSTVTRKHVSVISECLQEYYMLSRELAIYMDSKYNTTLDTECNRNPFCLRRRSAPKGGDHGQIRGRMLGKPSDFCARGVASCDTSMNINETGVPLRVAMHVTIPEIVTPYNFNKLMYRVMNGKTRYPGCNFICDDQSAFAPDANNNGLGLCKVVQRHIENKDPLIANRAPSLHRFAIMGHEARVHPYATFDETLAVCAALNLDFDGDEININVPQTEAQKAEIRHLITVKQNLMRDYELIIGVVQHAVIGAECATNERIQPLLLHEATIQQLLITGNDQECRRAFDRGWRAFNGHKSLTGRQFMQLILPTYDGSYILTKKSLNLCIRETIQCLDDMNHAAALIGFITRILETIASLSGTSVLLDDIMFKSSPVTYANANDVLEQAKCFAYQQKRLFETQTSSSTPAAITSQSNKNPAIPNYLNILGLSVADVGKDLPCVTNHSDVVDASTALDAIELEDDLCEMLGRFRDLLGRPLLEHLANKGHTRSGIDTIVSSGAKGDVTAIVQNLRAVGQQNNENSMRYQDSTSHYYRDECSKYGFVRHALIDSLTPTEYFFCLRSGRVGLVRTSCETAGIGYVYRKIFKSLEDLRICFGNTVRNATGNVILFSYGYDTTFLRAQALETVVRNIKDCVDRFSTNNDAMSVLEVEHLLLLRQRLVLADFPSLSVLFPLQFDRMCDTVMCETALAKRNMLTNDDFEEEEEEAATRHQKQRKPHRCVAVNWNAARNRVCTLWTNLVVHGEIPATPAHELCFFEQLSTRMLRDRGYLQCTQMFEAYMQHVEHMLLSNMCCAGDACGMKCSQDTTQPGTQAGLSLFRIAGEKTTVLQGTERFKEIINLPKTMQQPIMYIYLDKDVEDTFDAMSLVELRLVYIVQHFDDKPVLKPTSNDHFHQQDDETAEEENKQQHTKNIYLSLYLNKDAMHRRQLSPRIVAQYLRHVRVLLFDIQHVTITFAELEDVDWWVTVCVPESSSIWDAVAPEAKMQSPERAELLMHTLKTDKMLLAGIEGIRDFKVIEKTFVVANKAEDGCLMTSKRKCILAQGSNLQAVCALPGVDVSLTTSTHIWQVFQVFGIDAAEQAIYEGLMEALNITVESPASQHVKIIAATMCFSGKPSPMTYSGMTSRDPESWLQRALFERSYETFRGAGIAAHYNNMRGVSPAIMIGAPISLGTGGDFAIFNDKEPEIAPSSTQDHKIAAQRFLDANIKPLDQFVCPTPFVTNFLAMVAADTTPQNERIKLTIPTQHHAIARAKTTQSKKRKKDTTTNANKRRKTCFYLTAHKNKAIFIPSSPVLSSRSLTHYRTDTFIPSSPVLSTHKRKLV